MPKSFDTIGAERGILMSLFRSIYDEAVLLALEDESIPSGIQAFDEKSEKEYMLKVYQKAAMCVHCLEKDSDVLNALRIQSESMRRDPDSNSLIIGSFQEYDEEGQSISLIADISYDDDNKEEKSRKTSIETTSRQRNFIISNLPIIKDDIESRIECLSKGDCILIALGVPALGAAPQIESNQYVGKVVWIEKYDPHDKIVGTLDRDSR